MSAEDRFHDNPNGVITDTQNRKEWLPKDSYQDVGKWQSWQEAESYIKLMRSVYAGGQNDWRLPTEEEALSLYDEELQSLDWEGKEIHIHNVFVPRSSRYLWTSTVSDEDKVLRVNLSDGSTEYVDKTTQELMGARLVRDITN